MALRVFTVSAKQLREMVNFPRPTPEYSRELEPRGVKFSYFCLKKSVLISVGTENIKIRFYSAVDISVAVIIS